MDARIAVLASGSGTNLQALFDDPVVGPWVVLVVSDQPSARALERARDRGVKAVVVEPGLHETRVDHDRALVQVLQAESIDYVVLAGYMRILTAEIVQRFENRMLNIHPALLPAFPGAHPVRDALAWGSKVSGVTVHIVDLQVDHGPIVLQEAVPVLPGDDETALHGRIQKVEHRLYPRAVRLLVEGRLRVEGRLVKIQEDSPEAATEAASEAATR